jgi:hypothetical protein
MTQAFITLTANSSTIAGTGSTAAGAPARPGLPDMTTGAAAW